VNADDTVTAYSVDLQQGAGLGPTYLTGIFYAETDTNPDGTTRTGANPAGNWKAQGWNYSGGMIGLHSFDFYGLGELIAAGSNDRSTPVTGGTGSFGTAQGEVRMAPAATAGRITVEFELWGATPGR